MAGFGSHPLGVHLMSVLMMNIGVPNDHKVTGMSSNRKSRQSPPGQKILPELPELLSPDTSSLPDATFGSGMPHGFLG